MKPRSPEFTQREILLEVREMLSEILLEKPATLTLIDQRIKNLPFQKLLDLYTKVPAIKLKLESVYWNGNNEAEKNQIIA